MHKEILLVEDNPDDVELTRIAFDEAKAMRVSSTSSGLSSTSRISLCIRRSPPPALAPAIRG